MSARTMFKGYLDLGEGLQVPVRLYAAVRDTGVHFRLLHEKDGEPVVERMVDPETGKPVAPEEIRRGLEVEEGRFVLFEPEELEAIAPPTERRISVDRFVETAAIGHAWYDRPYYLGPDGDAAAYFALAKALAASGRDGIARWAMRRHHQLAALRSDGEWLALVRLRHTREVVPAGALPSPGRTRLDPQQLKLAEQLVSALSGSFDPAAYPDTYTGRLREIVEAKASGKTIRAPRRRGRSEAEDLEKALRESLKKAGKHAA